MQGNAPMQPGQGAGFSLRDLGEIGGEQTVTLLQTEMPAHLHTAQGGGASDSTSPVNNAWSTLGTTRTPPPLYQTTSNAQMNPFALGITGGNLPHNNMPPFLGLTFIIALQGVFPPRT